ncbi:MAG: BolA/IbaG family iron-sulfur metabolism protein [Pseudomonadota bacterium]
MAMDVSQIKSLIEAELPGASVTLEALIDDGDHYRAEVIASQFRGKSRVQQHQMVYQALGERMGTTLHALSLVTKVKD